jgi:hypothetical protein
VGSLIGPGVRAVPCPLCGRLAPQPVHGLALQEAHYSVGTRLDWGHTPRHTRLALAAYSITLSGNVRPSAPAVSPLGDWPEDPENSLQINLLTQDGDAAE